MSTSKQENEIVVEVDECGIYISPDVNVKPIIPDRAAPGEYLGPDFLGGRGGAPQQLRPTPEDDLEFIKDAPLTPKTQSADYVRTSDYLPKGKK